jgi:O-methyltransferase
MFDDAKERLWNLFSNRVMLSFGVQERFARQQFFFNAFRALSFNGIDGDYAEFGSWGGRTFAMAYGAARRFAHPARLWAFDSFQGLPAGGETEHPQWQTGAMSTPLAEFHRICRKNGVPQDRYTVVPGFYEQSLAALGAQDGPRNIALVYIDCDLYTSTKSVLDFLMPRLKQGMIIAFDDYYCWSQSQPAGERRAADEAFHGNHRWGLSRYVQYGWAGQSFVVDDRRLGAG